MAFADNLKSIRKINSISQEDLAELLDVSRQAVSKWEQGLGYPEVEKLLLLSKRLNISLDELMKETAETENAAFKLSSTPIPAESEKKGTGKRKRRALILSASIAAVLLISAACVWVYFRAQAQQDIASASASGTRLEYGTVLARYADSIAIEAKDVVIPTYGKIHPDKQLYYVFYVDENTAFENVTGPRVSPLLNIEVGSEIEVQFPVDENNKTLPQIQSGSSPFFRTDILASSIKVLSVPETSTDG